MSWLKTSAASKISKRSAKETAADAVSGMSWFRTQRSQSAKGSTRGEKKSTAGEDKSDGEDLTKEIDGEVKDNFTWTCTKCEETIRAMTKKKLAYKVQLHLQLRHKDALKDAMQK